MYRILEPIKVGPVELRNRMAYLGMAKNLSTADNYISDRQIAYYSNFAKNGVALITTGACIVSPDYPSQMLCQPGLYDDKFIPGLKKLVDSIHSFGAKIIFQPWHPGKCVYNCAPTQTKCCADFTIEEIHHIQDQYVEGIVRTYKAGADGVEFHMAHNYLPEQFAVPAFNTRTDEYGSDTLENATRFSVEIIRRAKELCGEDFLFVVKINGSDFGGEGTMTEDRCAKICQILEKEGVHLFTISAGGGLTDFTGTSGDGTKAEGWKIPLASYVKKEVSVPVMATGTIRHLEVMEQALENGDCDMIGMGRGFLAEPEFITKVQSGRIDELSYCINCLNCFIKYQPGCGHCSANPVATFESIDPELNANGDGRCVVIIGAGPSGMEAALAAAKRGFKPVIIDKAGHLGGSAYYASKPSGKSKIDWMLESYRLRLEKAGVKIMLNTEAEENLVKSFDPYKVLVATGADPIVPSSIPGIHNNIVTEANQALNCIQLIENKTVAVIGGGMVGLEIANTYSQMGNKAIVIEMLPANQVPMTLAGMVAKIHSQKNGCELRYGEKLVEISENSIFTETAEGAKNEVYVDKVILCMGYRPSKALFDHLSASMDNIIWVGPETGADNLPNAIRRGYLAGMNL